MLKQKPCKSCNKELPSDATFCYHCGKIKPIKTPKWQIIIFIIILSIIGYTITKDAIKTKKIKAANINQTTITQVVNNKVNINDTMGITLKEFKVAYNKRLKNYDNGEFKLKFFAKDISKTDGLSIYTINQDPYLLIIRVNKNSNKIIDIQILGDLSSGENNDEQIRDFMMITEYAANVLDCSIVKSIDVHEAASMMFNLWSKIEIDNQTPSVLINQFRVTLSIIENKSHDGNTHIALFIRNEN